jgi:hypothetical protein
MSFHDVRDILTAVVAGILSVIRFMDGFSGRRRQERSDGRLEDLEAETSRSPREGPTE